MYGFYLFIVNVYILTYMIYIYFDMFRKTSLRVMQLNWGTRFVINFHNFITFYGNRDLLVSMSTYRMYVGHN